MPTAPKYTGTCRQCAQEVTLYWADGTFEGKPSALPAWRFSEHQIDSERCEGSLSVHTLT